LEKGKKTLNVDHVIEALKKLKFDNYLKNIMTENLNMNEENEDKEIVDKDPLEMKDLINKKKKRKIKKKNKIEPDEEMEKKQLELFEKSKSETFNLYINNGPASSLNSLGNGNGHFVSQPMSFNSILERNNIHTNKEINFDEN
jgi:hypothetical protein